jgi:BarA-like signal transduction histidine kinase
MMVAPVNERNTDTSALEVVYELQASKAPANDYDVMITHKLPFL